MKKDNSKTVKENKVQTAAPTKKHTDGKHQPPVKNKLTDTVKNTAATTPGLNQSKTSKQEILLSDE